MEREGCDLVGVFYDFLLEDEGMCFCYVFFFNYVDYSYDVVGVMMCYSCSVFGLGDGGAYCGVMVDLSL